MFYFILILHSTGSSFFYNRHINFSSHCLMILHFVSNILPSTGSLLSFFLTRNLYLSSNCLVIHRPFFIQASTGLFHRFVFPAIIILYSSTSILRNKAFRQFFNITSVIFFSLFVRNI